MTGSAAAAQGTRDENRSILVFGLGGRLCALPSSAVGEIVFLPTLARPPGAPSFLEGFMNVEGRAIPVIRLAHLLDLPATSSNLYAPIVIMKGAEPVAVLVDRLSDVRRVAAADILPVDDAAAFGGCLDAEIGSAADGIIHLLSPSRLLLAQESRRLAEFRAREQERLAALDDTAP